MHGTARQRCQVEQVADAVEHAEPLAQLAHLGFQIIRAQRVEAL